MLILWYWPKCRRSSQVLQNRAYDYLTKTDAIYTMPAMGSSLRKQRERKQREQLILDSALHVLIKDGYLALNMDRIAEAIEYSKGTVYQHFTCKEDVLAAMVLQTIGKRAELFNRAATFQGNPRERLLAISVAEDIFFDLYPDHIRALQIVRVSSILKKASVERQLALRSVETRNLDLVTGMIRDAISRGDLAVSDGAHPVELAFGLWGMIFGSRAIMTSDIDLDEIGIPDPSGSLRRNLNAMLDGFGWKPLSTEFDYGPVRERVRTELFARELRLLKRA